MSIEKVGVQDFIGIRKPYVTATTDMVASIDKAAKHYQLIGRPNKALLNFADFLVIKSSGGTA